MRKLFMFLAVAGLATFGTACSSSDDSNPVKPGETATLVVSTSKATAEVGEKVTITVKEGTTDVTAKANILVNGTKISGNELTSDIAGEFKVTATKDGAKDAAAVVVKFVAKGTVLKKLVLTATPSTIELNAETVFKVTLDNVDVTTTSTIKVDGVAVTGGKYKGTVAGTYTAVASQAGAEDSAAVTIIVKPAAADQPMNSILLDNELADVNASYFELSVRNYPTGTGNEVVKGPTVYNYPGGGYANGYFVNVVYFNGTAVEEDPFFYTLILVKNPTIVIENNTIVDFGTTALPSPTAVIAVGSGGGVVNGLQMPAAAGTGTFEVTSLVLDAESNGTTAFTLKFEQDDQKAVVKYNGQTFIDEYDVTPPAARTATSSNASSSRKVSTFKKNTNLRGLNLKVSLK